MLFVSPETNKIPSRTSEPRLSHQNQLLGFGPLRRLQLIVVNPAGRLNSLPPNDMLSGFQILVHQLGHFLAELVVYLQDRMTRLVEVKLDDRRGVKGVGVALLQLDPRGIRAGCRQPIRHAGDSQGIHQEHGRIGIGRGGIRPVQGEFQGAASHRRPDPSDRIGVPGLGPGSDHGPGEHIDDPDAVVRVPVFRQEDLRMSVAVHIVEVVRIEIGIGPADQGKVVELREAFRMVNPAALGDAVQNIEIMRPVGAVVKERPLVPVRARRGPKGIDGRECRGAQNNRC